VYHEDGGSMFLLNVVTIYLTTHDSKLHGNENSGYIKGRVFSDQLSDRITFAINFVSSDSCITI
jgi:hypothetical protein